MNLTLPGFGGGQTAQPDAAPRTPLTPDLTRAASARQRFFGTRPTDALAGAQAPKRGDSEEEGFFARLAKLLGAGGAGMKKKAGD